MQAGKFLALKSLRFVLHDAYIFATFPDGRPVVFDREVAAGETNSKEECGNGMQSDDGGSTQGILVFFSFVILPGR